MRYLLNAGSTITAHALSERTAADHASEPHTIKCGRIIKRGSRCPLHGGDRRTLTTNQRGYGHKRRLRRKALLPLAIGNPCPLCSKPMLATQQLDLDLASV